MQVGEFKMVNQDKLERAIHGTVGGNGTLSGGVGDKAKPTEILAEYDRLGGLILMNGKYKVKTGSFYDFKKKAPKTKPKPVLLFNINGEIIEVDGSKPLPLEVLAAEQAEERKTKKRKAAAAKKAAAKSKKKSSKKKVKDEDDEDEEEDIDEDESDDEDEEEDSDDEDSEDDEDGDLA